jgi:RimJ/RimL family protein N-acetyltransferase
VLHPDHVGHGYATEAVGEILRVCFDQLGLRRVVAGCFAANTATWQLMERVGMRREQHTARRAAPLRRVAGRVRLRAVGRRVARTCRPALYACATRSVRRRTRRKRTVSSAIIPVDIGL